MREKLRLLTINDLEQLPDPDWLIHDLIQVGSFVNLYGAPKSGKSFLALDWALSVAGGTPWLGHQVRQGPVVYVYAENPAGLKQRVPAWSDAHGGAKPDQFFMFPSRVNIAEAPERKQLETVIADALRDTKPALIIIDTLAKCFGGGDENSNADMSRFVDGCEALRERFACAVVVVHHSGKDSHAGSRGATALPGAIDAQFGVAKQADGKIRLRNEMQRDAEEHADVWLRLKRSLNSVVVEKTTSPARAEREKKLTNREKVLAVLAEHPDGLSAEQWKAEAEAAGVKKTQFYRVRRALLEEGSAIRDGDQFVPAAVTWKPQVVTTSGPSSVAPAAAA